MTPLDRLSTLYGIEADYTDISKRRHIVGQDTKRALLAAMGVPAADDLAVQQSLESTVRQRAISPVSIATAGQPLICDVRLTGAVSWSVESEDGDRHEGGATLYKGSVLSTGLSLPPGYHRLLLEYGKGEQASSSIICAPERAVGPADLGAANSWGVALPLYGLHSDRNPGIGDFADLGELAEGLAGLGASMLAINPVHALFPTLPQRFSPYSPSSRQFLNVMHIAVEVDPETSANGLVDYGTIAPLKLQALERSHRGEHRVDGAMERQAIFDALFEHFHAANPACRTWRDWPEPYRRPDSPAVAAFAAERRERVAFYTCLQCLAREQLTEAQARARSAGMAIGLCLDLAVGVEPGGADAWAGQAYMADGVHLGAPPDHFNPGGQDWALAPFNPHALRESAYAPFVDMLRASVRVAGALRIDHALGLQRCFWIPKDVPGGYVRYPLQELLAVIKLESLRHRCIVIGEDLGNVPKGLRPALDDAGLLGARILYFESGRRAADYPKTCVASVTSHDLPTLKGFWRGRDIDWRERLDLYPDEDAMQAERSARSEDREVLLKLLVDEGLLAPDIDPEPQELLESVYRFLARTPADIVLLQLEDMLGAVEQANLPGTIDGHPNWRRRLSLSVSDIPHDRDVRRLAAILREEGR